MKNIVNKKTFLSTYNYKIFGMRELNKYGYWFPLNPSTELAEVIANLLTDGHLASKKLKNRRTFDYISFFSDEDKELKHFQKKIERLFNIKSKRRYWGKRYNSRSRGVIICNSSLERTLMLCGVPLGDKTIIEFNVPKWIKNSNKKIQASFLRGLFDCDGSINYDNYSKRWEIRFYSFKIMELDKNLKNYLKEIQEILLKFGIKSYITKNHGPRKRKKDGKSTIGYCVKITNKNSILKFKQISFNVKHKKEKLQKAIEWAGISSGQLEKGR